MDRRLRARRHHEREQAQRAVAGAEQQPLADAAAHAAVGVALLVDGGSHAGRRAARRSAGGWRRRRAAGDRAAAIAARTPATKPRTAGVSRRYSSAGTRASVAAAGRRDQASDRPLRVAGLQRRRGAVLVHEVRPHRLRRRARRDPPPARGCRARAAPAARPRWPPGRPGAATSAGTPVGSRHRTSRVAPGRRGVEVGRRSTRRRRRSRARRSRTGANTHGIAHEAVIASATRRRGRARRAEDDPPPGARDPRSTRADARRSARPSARHPRAGAPASGRCRRAGQQRRARERAARRGERDRRGRQRRGRAPSPSAAQRRAASRGAVAVAVARSRRRRRGSSRAGAAGACPAASRAATIEPADVPTKASAARRSMPAASSMPARTPFIQRLADHAAAGEHEHVGGERRALRRLPATRWYVITYACMASLSTSIERQIHIGPRVRALREAMDLSLRDLAERSGVCAPMLCQVERGETSPTLAVAARIAAGLELRLSQLLRLDEAGWCRSCAPTSAAAAAAPRHRFEILTAPLPGLRAELWRHALAAGAQHRRPRRPADARARQPRDRARRDRRGRARHRRRAPRARPPATP